LFEDLPIEKHDGTQRLALGRGSDMAFHGEMGQKLLDLLPPHVARMPFVMKENETFHPAQVGFLGA
jgi:hypothetical protein